MTRLPLARRLLVACLLVTAGCGDARHAADAGTSLLTPVDSLVAVAESLYWQGEYAEARAVWTEALEDNANPDSALEPRILTWLGLAAYRQGEFAESRQLGEQALALKHERGLEADLFRSYNALGLVAWAEGRLSEATELLGRAYDRARADGDESALARAGNNLGLLYAESGDFGRAREQFVDAGTTARRIGDRRSEGGALTNLGMLNIWVGDPRAAIEALENARRLYRTVDWSTGEQNALGQLGTAYLALGQPDRALAALDSALAISRRLGLRQEEASNLEWLANFYREAGDLQRALQLFAQAQAINAELGLRMEAASVLRQQAVVLFSLGQPEGAALKAEEALRLHEEVGAGFEELLDLLLLAELEHAGGQPARAAAHLSSGRRLAGQLDAPIARIRLALAEARIAERAGKPERVLSALGEIEADLAGTELALEWEAHALSARALARLERLEEAVAAGRTAISAVERVRNRFAAPTLRTAYTSDKATVYADLAVALLRLGRSEEAFEVADAARGRALLEHLGAARATLRPGTLARELAGGEELLLRIDTLVKQLAEVEQVPQRERGPAATRAAHELATRLHAARSEYEALLVRLASQEEPAAALLGAVRPSASRTRAALAPHEALIQYLLLPDRLLIFVVTRGGIHTLESPTTAAQLVSRVRLARDLLGQPDASPRAVAAASGTLHEELLGPVRQAGLLEDVRRLLIVPHGALAYLPFAGLRDLSGGRYLADEFVLTTLPSAAALQALRSRETVGPTLVSPRPAVFAPFPGRLPATRREAESFRRVMQRARAWQGSRATEPALRRALTEGGVVHVATHGVLNTHNPMFSRLELARGRSGGSADDGRLEVHELLSLSVHSPLVFLSGCETGLGTAWSTDFVRGEDYATLAQAFLYAGAQNVIATLWRIEDEGAAEFAQHFYRHLQTHAPADALAAAQREMQQHPRYADPYYWAGYVLSGEGGIGLTRNTRVPRPYN